MNSLDGTIPSELGQLTSLRKLLLVLVNAECSCWKLCFVSYLPCDLALLSSGITVDLKLHENSLVGTIPPQLGRLTSLRKCRSKGSFLCLCLVLHHSFHSCSCSSHLSSSLLPRSPDGLTENLYVKENNLSGTIPSELGCLTSLGKCHSLP